MSKFKAMKFWIGDDPACSERVQKMLFDMGYKWGSDGKRVMYIGDKYISTVPVRWVRVEGSLFWGGSRGSFDELLCEEINIDWLRTPKQETIELNGKNYIKADVEAALEKLKPVEGM